VELHGGSIRVISEPQKGSQFIFTLPISTVKPQQSVKSEAVPEFLFDNTIASAVNPDLKIGFQILVVDDEPVNLEVVTSQLSIEEYILSIEEYMVTTASTGQEALRKIEENNGYDLLILDIMLPDISGYEVCRWIRERYSLLELPVLMLTARNRTEDIVQAFQAGANDYLSKPFDRNELLARARTLLTLKKVMKQVVTAELQFLQAQIQPHFIFNTLNTIMVFCRQDPNKAAELLDELGNYLRGKFSFSNADELIPLEKELDFVNSYLAIEKVRLDERLQVSYDLDTNLDVYIPSLILQPIVENAVRHGIRPKKEGGKVEITAHRENHNVIIKVKDTGVGMTPEKVQLVLKGQDPEAGIGICNVNKRLRSYYGQGLTIESEEGKGTEVTIRIPVGE